jgi:hypothetical protein
MQALIHRLIDDEAGFIISDELILVGTITVLSMAVGLVEVSFAVNQELKDVASSFDSINQNHNYRGGGHHGGSRGYRNGDDHNGYGYNSDQLDFAGAVAESH